MSFFKKAVHKHVNGPAQPDGTHLDLKHLPGLHFPLKKLKSEPRILNLCKSSEKFTC